MSEIIRLAGRRRRASDLGDPLNVVIPDPAPYPPLPRLDTGRQMLDNFVNPAGTTWIVPSYPTGSRSDIFSILPGFKYSKKTEDAFLDILRRPGAYSKTEFKQAVRRGLMNYYISQRPFPRRSELDNPETHKANIASRARMARKYANEILDNVLMSRYLQNITFNEKPRRRVRKDRDWGAPWYWDISKVHTYGGKTDEIKAARKASANKIYKKWMENMMRKAAIEFTRKYPARANRIVHGFY